ncbi:MAG: exodeoxyribonuclease VII large subunit [Actinobacteria bacterium BACL15 MAG-120619-bin91]|jgi:exodeoxyribonuclease VII large subunit|uniref:Exodeoxyribonuclease 7 large subunit n=2 Tax=ac1 cluster TaxID=1655545 RepID=A0A0R2PSB3_9ACTN|nr:MAG: exodeoxyribonuclease VII large subunit [Actinobacteria bacterium BACL15 MAG-120619-bin91]KRO37786.1 MAG: exodeoxyribonuclease VII large subunit [Actinobacteria bacterium BACL15 MAG-120823-bin78]
MFETSSEAPATVRTVSEAIKEYVDRLGPIWIEGEISELNERSGMMAFMRLRDPSVDMSISVMCHKSVIAAVKPLPDNARIVMYAKPSWYTKNGSLSFSAREIRQVGVGELLARLEALKNLLAGEGLFNSDRKVALPLLPKVIGLICGRNTDAEKDVVENAKRRWPSVQFEIREVTVQGAAAVSEVSDALRELEANKDVEVIIITRGGGSFEDLLPFSDEGLVRLAASCTTPIVSAIGHEKDSPLLDLVADYRASTPTDAAKRVVPDISEEIAMIEALQDRARRTLVNRLDLELTRITNFRNRPVMKDPHVLITTRAEIIAGLRDRSNRSFGASIKLAKEELKQIKARVRALSPQSTLDRGYSVVQLPDGQIVTDPKRLKAGDELRLRLAKGETKATAQGN